MRILITVFFNAPLGGLQLHVRAQAKALTAAGFEPVVLVKPGPFADMLSSEGIMTIETDFADPEPAAAVALASGPFGLVLAHPFKSRVAGMAVAKAQAIPCIVTMHGQYLDGMPQWKDEVSLVTAVSSAIRDSLVAQAAIDPKKIVVIANGVDTDLYQPAAAARLSGMFPDLPLNDKRPRIVFSSRLDVDKQFILDVVKETWTRMIDLNQFDQDWWIAGDGTQRADMELAAQQVDQAAGRKVVHFLGWLEEEGLAAVYAAADLAIAPGRCALEAMACATPVIAIGSKGYAGLVDEDNFLAGAYGNFGGAGTKWDDYLPGRMHGEIESIIHNPERLKSLGQTMSGMMKAFFAQAWLDTQLLALVRTRLRSTDKAGAVLEAAQVVNAYGGA